GGPDLRDRQATGPGDASLPPCIEQNGSLVAPEDVQEALQLDLLDTAERAPQRHAQLIAMNAGVPRGNQGAGQSLPPPAVAPGAAEEDRLRLGAVNGPLPLPDVGGVLRRR